MNKAPHSSEQQPLPEFFPTIIVDANLGRYVSNFDIDFAKLTATLEEARMDPGQIEETGITFSATRDKHHSSEAVGRVTNGTDITVNPVDFIMSATKKYYDTDDEWRRDHFREAHPSNRVSEVLRHELEHRIVAAEGGMPEEERHSKTTARKLVAASLLPFLAIPTAVITKEVYLPSQTIGEYAATFVGVGTIATTTAFKLSRKVIKNGYRNSPEENRAYDVETFECWGLVSLILKTANLKEPDQEAGAA